jgi:hypothetical protein
MMGCFFFFFTSIFALKQVGDLLREMLVNEDSENAYMFKENERKEFIYHLFSSFVIGGSLCQPETNIEK